MLTLLETCIALVLIVLSLVGWGMLAVRLLRLPEKTPVVPMAWLGWCTTQVSSLGWSLFYPISTGYALAVLLIGLFPTVLYFQRSAVKCSPSAIGFLAKSWMIKPESILLSGLLFWLAWKSSDPLMIPDSGLYYLSTIRWLNEYGATPGLGNLHERLAFNNAFFIQAAWLNALPLVSEGFRLANPLLLLLLGTECLLRVEKWRRSGQFATEVEREALNGWFALLLLPIVLYWSARLSISSPSPDTANAVLQILMIWYMIQLLHFKQVASSRWQYPILIILAASLITVKLSGLIFSLVLVGCLVYWRWQLAASQGDWISKVLTARDRGSPLFAVIMLGLWQLHGVISSGYFLFPSSLFPVPVDWLMPAEELQRTLLWIKSWARIPGVSPWNANGVETQQVWVMQWFIRDILSRGVDVVYPVMFSILLLSTSLFLMVKGAKIPLTFFLPLFPVLAGLVFWFVTAPSPRFARALFQLSPIVASLPLVYALPKVFPKLRHTHMFLMLLFLITLPLLLWIPLKSTQAIAETFRDPSVLVKSNETPAPQLEYRTNPLGTRIQIPVAGDQCWDAQLPCGPSLAKNLILRGDDLASGFRIFKP